MVGIGLSVVECVIEVFVVPIIGATKGTVVDGIDVRGEFVEGLLGMEIVSGGGVQGVEGRGSGCIGIIIGIRVGGWLLSDKGGREDFGLSLFMGGVADDLDVCGIILTILGPPI